MGARSVGRWRRILLAAAALLVLDQIVQHTVLGDGVLFRRRVAPFDPPLFAPLHFRRLSEIQALVRGASNVRAGTVFDADLGWCPRPGTRVGRFTYDWAGCRVGDKPLARVKPEGVRRIAALGGSFARGDEVDGHEAWPALVGALPGVEVANLGMGGYGVDQALLRFRRDGRPLAPDEVWLAYFPKGSLRITTHFSPLLRHWTTAVAFKPRFVLEDEGRLRLVPSPVREPADFVRLMQDQAALLSAVGATDDWIRRAPRAYAPRGSSWTHWFASTRLLLTLHESRGRALEPWLTEQTEVRALLSALIRTMEAEVAASGARFRLLVLPSQTDLRGWAEDGGRGYWTDLTEELAATGIEVLDLTPMLANAGATDDPSFWMPGGHYSPKTNRLVAERAAAEWLE